VTCSNCSTLSCSGSLCSGTSSSITCNGATQTCPSSPPPQEPTCPTLDVNGCCLSNGRLVCY
jgi:hypothetical protein